ncbi:MAG TPA: hypothetical protein VFT29_12780 [Gemmatimonadaceae bacterium]|nr:hypothetical protein [Gemmatimonadaceae bacterium]
MRRRNAPGVVLLALAVALLFVPIAAASNADRATQTLTLLSLTAALGLMGLTWVALRQRGASAAYLGLGALAGACLTTFLVSSVRDPASPPVAALVARQFEIAAINAVALWVMVVSVRRLFPPPARGLAVAAIALLAIALFPFPLLLVQPGVAPLNLIDVRQQLHAGVMYWTTGALLLVVPFLALTTLPGDWFEQFWSNATGRVVAISNRVFATALVVVALALAIVFTWYSFDARPTTADEIAQLWHARILLTGRLALPPDSNPEFFAIDNVIDRPIWMSQFPIGGPAVMAVGLLLRAAWLVNPVLTALTALNVYRFTQRAYGEAQARAAAAVFVVSPMVLLMGGTHMNHMPTAWLVTLGLASLPVWMATSETPVLRRSAALIGLALGCAMTIRPLDGVVAGLIVGLAMIATAARDRTRARSLLVAIAAGAVPVALLLVANWRTTGSPLRFGYEVLWGPNHSLGLHDDPTGHPHTPWRALLLGVKYGVQLNWISTAWPVPVILIVATGLLLVRERPMRWDVLLLALFGAQLFVYAFYWHDGQFVGPRFMFTAVPALLILAARFPFIAGARWSGVPRRIALVVIPVCIGVAWLRHMPPFGVQGVASEFRGSRTRLKLDPPIEVTTGRVQNALIFVQEGAATRLLRRLWGIGVSRADAARLVADADACTLLDAVIAEESRSPADSAGMVARIERVAKPFVEDDENVHAPDPNLKINSPSSLTPACRREIALDSRLRNTVAYGAMLLNNGLDRDGHVDGPALYVINLGERNEVLRRRFAGRQWYRYEVPRGRPDSLPILVPYDSTR